MGVYALDQALLLAEQSGLDLVEVAPTAVPPVCRIMDFGKFKYQNKKRARDAKKNQTVIRIKEMKVRPKIDPHDFEMKAKQGRKFLMAGDKLKINLVFRGREIALREMGMELVARITRYVEDIASVESAPRQEGRIITVLLSPKAAGVRQAVRKAEEKSAKSAAVSSEEQIQSASALGRTEHADENENQQERSQAIPPETQRQDQANAIL